jgi:hypothetical protein
MVFDQETPHEIRLGEWQDTPHAIALCAVLRVNRGELPTRYRDAALLLQPQVLRRSLQSARPCTPISCDGIMITPNASKYLPQIGLSSKRGCSGGAVMAASINTTNRL